MNQLLETMKQGNAVLGPFMKLSDPAIVEIFALAGFDFVILDAEHGPNSMETIENLIRAADARGITPIVRVLDNNPGLVQRALDIGAKGVQVPQINTLKQAKKLTESARFAPLGQRGACRFVRAADYSMRTKEDYFSKANDEVITVGHLEGQEGIENLDEILTAGIDVLFVGPYDLSHSLGVPGQVQHQKVVDKISEIRDKAQKAGVILGTFADDVQTAKSYRDQGFKYISISVDVGILASASSQLIGEFRA